jgi:hypothetical protein
MVALGGLVLVGEFFVLGRPSYAATGAILLSTLAALLVLVGQHRNTAALIYLGAALTFLAALDQAVALHHSEREAADRDRQLKDSRTDTRSMRKELADARAENRTFISQIGTLQKQLLEKSERNETLSRQLYVLQRAATDEVTGGRSFCYVMFASAQDGAVTLIAMQAGGNPVLDLVVRMVDVGQIERQGRQGLSVAAALGQTFHLGTLPPRDMRPFATARPSAAEAVWRFEFSARNGAWSQLSVLRRTSRGWASLDAVFPRRPRIVKFAELEALGRTPAFCMERDADFPVATEKEVLDWIGGKLLPRCADAPGFPE